MNSPLAAPAATAIKVAKAPTEAAQGGYTRKTKV